jgi:hypothetical protein
MLFLTGCASANAVKYPNANFSSTNPDNVAVYSNFPPMKYKTIGEIEGSGAPATDWGSVSNAMRKKAAAIGGDAVIIQVQDTPFVGAINTPGHIRGTTNAVSSGSGNLDAFASGNNVYGTYSGSSWGHATSNYTYTPPTSTPMYGKYARGVVIRFDDSEGVLRVVGKEAFDSINYKRADLTEKENEIRKYYLLMMSEAHRGTNKGRDFKKKLTELGFYELPPEEVERITADLNERIQDATFGKASQKPQKSQFGISPAKEKTTVAREPSKNVEVIEQLEKLVDLKERGALTEEEFQAQKKQVLNQ